MVLLRAHFCTVGKQHIPNATGVITTEPMYQYNFILKDTQPTDNRLLHLSVDGTNKLIVCKEHRERLLVTYDSLKN